MDGRQARIAELEELIALNQKLYYDAEPAISDEDFDALWSELEDLDPSNPILASIGRDKAEGWPKVEHRMPMGSQSKAMDPEEFESWALKNRFSPYIVQYKLDGALSPCRRRRADG
jgi:DNA ligase (NAD+)